MDEFVSGLGNKVVELSQDKWMKLAISMLIDIIGILTFLIPVVRPARAFASECASGRDAVLSALHRGACRGTVRHAHAHGVCCPVLSRPPEVRARGVAADV